MGQKHRNCIIKDVNAVCTNLERYDE